MNVTLYKSSISIHDENFIERMKSEKKQLIDRLKSGKPVKNEIVGGFAVPTHAERGIE